MIGFVMVFLFFCFIVVMAAYNGFALTILWEWFVVTTFGAPSLSLAAAIGLTIIVGFLIQPMKLPEENGDWKKAGKEAAMIVVRPTLSMGLGWVVFQFMGV